MFFDSFFILSKVTSLCTFPQKSNKISCSRLKKGEDFEEHTHTHTQRYKLVTSTTDIMPICYHGNPGSSPLQSPQFPSALWPTWIRLFLSLPPLIRRRWFFAPLGQRSFLFCTFSQLNRFNSHSKPCSPSFLCACTMFWALSDRHAPAAPPVCTHTHTHLLCFHAFFYFLFF